MDDGFFSSGIDRPFHAVKIRNIGRDEDIASDVSAVDRLIGNVNGIGIRRGITSVEKKSEENS